MSLADRLRSAGVSDRLAPRTTPLWQGPQAAGDRGGVSFSMLNRYLCCKERFRVNSILGVKSAPSFYAAMDYGNMWHACEEALAGGVPWLKMLDAEFKKLLANYPPQREVIEHWYTVCKVQFSVYVEHWSRHEDVKDRTPIFQEEVFDVVLTLPSGRKPRLRGKFDSVDLVGKGPKAGVYLMENKTKSEIDERALAQMLTFDLQVMIYLTAIRHGASNKRWPKELRDYPLRGVRYNVVRRPLSGGKGSISQHKPTKANPRGESKVEFYARLGKVIDENAETFFARWKVEISRGELDNFWTTCLCPLLENLCDWYEFVTTGDPFRPDPRGLHMRHPFGVRNILNEGGSSDLDEYMASGSMIGLVTVDKMFTELEEPPAPTAKGVAK